MLFPVTLVMLRFLSQMFMHVFASSIKHQVLMVDEKQTAYQ